MMHFRWESKSIPVLEDHMNKLRNLVAPILFSVSLGLVFVGCGQSPSPATETTTMETVQDAGKVHVGLDQVLEYARQSGADEKALSDLKGTLGQVEIKRSSISAKAMTDGQRAYAIGTGNWNYTYSVYYRVKNWYPQFDWARDGCSTQGINTGPYAEMFRDDCNQHDFGYYNFKKFSLATSWNRAAVDAAFYWNMMDTCQWYAKNRWANWQNSWKAGACRDGAWSFYITVLYAGWNYGFF
jgi:Prokaryotic phospholipase A2